MSRNTRKQRGFFPVLRPRKSKVSKFVKKRFQFENLERRLPLAADMPMDLSAHVDGHRSIAERDIVHACQAADPVQF